MPDPAELKTYRYNLGMRLLPYLNGGYLLGAILGLLGGWAGSAWGLVLAIVIMLTLVNTAVLVGYRRFKNIQMALFSMLVINALGNAAIVFLCGGYPTHLWIAFLAGSIGCGLFMSKRGIAVNLVLAGAGLIFPHLLSRLVIAAGIGIATQLLILLAAATVCYQLMRFSWNEQLKARQSGDKLLQENERLNYSLKGLGRSANQLVLLTDMGDQLQNCASLADVFFVISHFSGLLFPNEAGALFLCDTTCSDMYVAAIWGNYKPKSISLDREDCLALERGQVHVLDETKAGARCRHLVYAQGVQSLCIPLVAQGETLGVFHVRSGLNEAGKAYVVPIDGIKAILPLAKTASKQIALSLANLYLRESLREQSIRDPLTGMYNRRYLEETLERELLRAKRDGLPLTVIMMDIDHFKDFNDNFGHEAGDFVLKELSDLVKTQFRGGDIACRYGGEEFVFILPGSHLEAGHERAEELLHKVEDMKTIYQGKELDDITVSMGVATFPGHGTDGAALIKAADTGLYQAKSQGRNRVEIAEVIKPY